jgi:uncharacterized membrane protein
MEEEQGRSAERLVTFTDAVVAIAITLLALPLADIPGEWAKDGIGRVLDEALLPFVGFTISFFVIARLWWSHHRVFQHVVRWDGAVVRLTVLWLFTIVVLAPATALTRSLSPYGADGDPNPYANAGAVAIYIGVMTVSSALLTALARHVHRNPSLTDGHDTDSAKRLFGSIETTISFVIALVVGTAVPAINYFALLSLVVTGQIGRVIWNRRHPRG